MSDLLEKKHAPGGNPPPPRRRGPPRGDDDECLVYDPCGQDRLANGVRICGKPVYLGDLCRQHWLQKHGEPPR